MTTVQYITAEGLRKISSQKYLYILNYTENIFIKRTPSIRASIKGWKKNLKETSKLDINLIIPGHGPVKEKNEALKPMLSYFDRLIDNTRKFHEKNFSLSKAIETFPKENKEFVIPFSS